MTEREPVTDTVGLIRRLGEVAGERDAVRTENARLRAAVEHVRRWVVLRNAEEVSGAKALTRIEQVVNAVLEGAPDA